MDPRVPVSGFVSVFPVVVSVVFSQRFSGTLSVVLLGGVLPVVLWLVPEFHWLCVCWLAVVAGAGQLTGVHCSFPVVGPVNPL